MKTKPIAVITRVKSYKRCGRFAWKWLYHINGTAIGERLAGAVLWAKQRGMQPQKEWERTPLTESCEGI